MHPPDDLDEYLRGDSALSCQYRRESAPAPPPALDRRVLEMSRAAADLTAAHDPRTPQNLRAASAASPCLAPLAFAASVLTSVALVLAIVFGPQSAKRVDDAPRVVRVVAHAELPQPYTNNSKVVRPPSAWLADIAALRRAGRNREADEELRRFRDAYPTYSLYPAFSAAIRP
jgi:hypothetical protein